MTSTNRALFAGALAVAGITALSAAWSTAGAATCRARMDGQGTGQGIAGQGTEVAKSRAAANWSARVQARHGSSFAIFAKAQSVRYDCRQGAILEAKCVVSARPCR